MKKIPYLFKKDWIYFESTAKKYRLKILIAIVILVYLFFFTSNILIPHPVSQYYTIIGEKINYAPNRSVVVYDVIYDENAAMLEIVMAMTNNSYDNINDYYFFLVPEGRFNYQNIVVETVIHDSLITVLHIPNLKTFDEANLVFAPKISENLDEIPDDIVATLMFNENNIKYETIKTDAGRDDYLGLRIMANAESKEKEISAAEDILHSLTAKYEALETENEDLQENINLYTSSEQELIMQKIEGNAEIMLEVEAEIEKQQEKVYILQEEYLEMKNMLQKQTGN